MDDSLAKVDGNGHQDRNGSGASDAPKSSSGRFTHASGSRPLAGHTIKRGLGHGGFGEVYYATTDAGKEVALKLIRRNLDVELRGIRHCLNLKHPNLLAIFDIREDDSENTWVVMEYVAGKSLDDALADAPRGMTPDTAMRWFGGLARGVAYLHDHGVVHRDLKPGNIFSDEGIVKVGDYGLSKFISCSRRSGQTESVGTVHYMAPEVAGGRYGKEIDVYALGVILYEMLTGRVPFEGESMAEVLMKHLTAPPDVSMLAEPYRSVVCRALEKDPKNRYPSAQEMLGALPKRVSASDAEDPTQGPGVSPHGTMGSSRSGTPLDETVPYAETVDEEPIYHCVRTTAADVRKTWDEADLHPGLKVGIGVGAILLAWVTLGAWLPAAFFLGLLYLSYRIARVIVLAIMPSHREPRPRVVRPPGPVNPVHAARAKERWRRPDPTDPPDPRLELLQAKSTRQRVTELLGSMLISTLVAGVMCVVTVVLGSIGGAMVASPEQIAWLLLVSVAGAWCVLVPSKFWEGHDGEPLLRRFALLIVGLGLGAFACSTASHLLVTLPPLGPESTMVGYHLPGSFYAADKPLLPAYLACFGALLLLLRWWRQADPLRKARLSLFSMLIVLGAAWIVSKLCLFPLPWVMMVACIMSVSVQLAAPWIPTHERS